jgi:hypothetical protein
MRQLCAPVDVVCMLLSRTNDALLSLHPAVGDGFDLRAVLVVLEQEVSDGKEPTRIAALRCVSSCVCIRV